MKPSPKPIPKTPEPPRVPWLFIAVVAAITAVPFVVGKYLELNTHDPFDSGAYVYSAERILGGAHMGVDEKVSARMGTLLVNMLGVRLFGFSELGPKLIQGLFQVAALIFMAAALWRLWGRWAAAIGTFLAAFYLSAPVIAKFGNVKEQYMIACMVIGVCCTVFRHLGGRWGWTLGAGAVLVWGPLFKQTGVSAIAAVGLFTLAQPLFKARTWRQTGGEILLLLAGAALSLAPVLIWLGLQHAPLEYWPYSDILRVILPLGGDRVDDYIAKGRELVPMSEVAPRVLRYYGILSLPIILALGSLVAAAVRAAAQKTEAKDRFVILLAVWWALDMAFIWISPRSYEQYYLPLNASSAMLGGFVLGRYFDRLRTAAFKVPWVMAGAFGLILMVGLAWQIVFGIHRSPHSGAVYTNPDTGRPEGQNGYVQRLGEVRTARSGRGRPAWEYLATQIRDRSQPADRIFVWGWYPGIYVEAQRLSAAGYAFTSEMHVRSPEALGEMIDGILADFKKHPPKYIVDSRKRHFPWKQPPLELWPLVQLKDGKPQFLPKDEAAVAQYEAAWADLLKRQVSEEEAERFKVMKPLRDYVRRHYRNPRLIGMHVLMELDPSTLDQE